ncbi:MAG: ABC transporter substrate-binding protein [Acutalibacteraceae bacterium]|nr:ABC transporter substrate-binding protein [Acutalibacteraceae bacterium]
MNIFKKIIALLVVIMLLLLSGCRGNTDNTSSSLPADFVGDSSSERDYITLLYSASDTFNPYTATTDSNRQLCKLIYEPLLKLDNEFNISYSLAERVELNDKECTVTLKSISFSDGSQLTADDVVYSFNLAKNSSTEYGYKLYAAESASANGLRTVVFRLSKADPYFTNLLDFPILKKGSDKATTSDSVVLPPVGCGRYKVDDSLTKLTLNDESIRNAAEYSIKEIRLIDAPDSESLSHYVEIGAADMHYSDISDGNILRMSGKKVDININHLVYIGVNQSYGDLAKNELRQAISSAIDRTAVCRDGYYNNAIAATGFFNPLWEPVKSVQNIETTANQEITIENLEKIGYNSVGDKGIRQKSSGTRLQFDMLVNKENRMRVAAAQLVANQLTNFGIKINIVEKSYADYITALSSGNFQLYFAEVALTPNMDLSSLVAEGGSAAYGVKKNDKTEVTGSSETSDAEGVSDTESIVETEETGATAAELIEGLYSGKNTVADVASVLQTEMPLIPVCYRTGVLFYNDNIENVNDSSVSDIYFSIESYKYNN